MRIDFDIHGKVQAKQRPRFNGKYAYTPEKTRNYESWVKLWFVTKYKDFKPLEKPLRVCIYAYFPIPTSKSKKVREEMSKGIIKPTIKPDTDNIAKSILDALNGLAFIDDKQVYELYVRKEYGIVPYARVIIEECE